MHARHAHQLRFWMMACHMANLVGKYARNFVWRGCSFQKPPCNHDMTAGKGERVLDGNVINAHLQWRHVRVALSQAAEHRGNSAIARRTMADLCLVNQRRFHLLANALAPGIGQQDCYSLRRVIEREIDKASQDNKAAANPEEQSHGAPWIEPAIEMRRGGHQLLYEFVIAKAEARAR